MQFHAFTVGAGIVYNFSRVFHEVAEKMGVTEWLKVEPDDVEENEKIKAYASRDSKVFRKVFEYVKNNPRKASPELNAFLGILGGLGPIKKKDIEIGLYTTDTGIGHFCGRILYEYLREEGYRLVSEPTVIRKWGWGPVFFDESLSEVMDKIARVIYSKKKQGYITCLNATGGFKPETGFAIIAALLVEADYIYYIHEKFKQPVILPNPPLSLKKEYLEILKRFQQPIYIGDARNILQQLIPIGDPVQILVERKLLQTKNGTVTLRNWVKILLKILEQ